MTARDDMDPVLYYNSHPGRGGRLPDEPGPPPPRCPESALAASMSSIRPGLRPPKRTMRSGSPNGGRRPS